MSKKSNAILESIRLQTNKINAESVRTYTTGQLKRDALQAVKDNEEGLGERIDLFVNDLLHWHGNIMLDACGGRVSEIEDSEDARKAIMESVMIGGQDMKRIMRQTLPGALGVMRECVADVILKIVSEALVTAHLSKQTKSLPLPEDK